MSVRPSERPQMHFPLDGRRKQLDRGEPTWSVNDGRNEGESTRNGAEKVTRNFAYTHTPTDTSGNTREKLIGRCLPACVSALLSSLIPPPPSASLGVQQSHRNCRKAGNKRQTTAGLSISNSVNSRSHITTLAVFHWLSAVRRVISAAANGEDEDCGAMAAKAEAEAEVEDPVVAAMDRWVLGLLFDCNCAEEGICKAINFSVKR
ncbi:unnamed protein product [Ceratitis capitata]|uniref:(Mediterranean fruit fly) hypothetical protein n=1 Tax=Ceratitis capitata TaxID=7213 RepID=A0A811V1B3_CERCA|nr:unnamed protein product [Ceratitis capitata]